MGETHPAGAREGHSLKAQVVRDLVIEEAEEADLCVDDAVGEVVGMVADVGC